MRPYKISSVRVYSSTEPIRFASLVSEMAALAMLPHTRELVRHVVPVRGLTTAVNERRNLS